MFYADLDLEVNKIIKTYLNRIAASVEKSAINAGPASCSIKSRKTDVYKKLHI